MSILTIVIMLCFSLAVFAMIYIAANAYITKQERDSQTKVALEMLGAEVRCLVRYYYQLLDETADAPLYVRAALLRLIPVLQYLSEICQDRTTVKKTAFLIGVIKALPHIPHGALLYPRPRVYNQTPGAG